LLSKNHKGLMKGIERYGAYLLLFFIYLYWIKWRRSWRCCLLAFLWQKLKKKLKSILWFFIYLYWIQGCRNKLKKNQDDCTRAIQWTLILIFSNFFSNVRITRHVSHKKNNPKKKEKKILDVQSLKL
jgi:hypothetical protein